MIDNDAGEACFKILVVGSTDPIELVRTLHASAKEENRSELTVHDDPSWSTASFSMGFGTMQSKGRPVRAHFSGHRGLGLLAAQSADLQAAFAGGDAVIVRAGSDVEDDLARSATLLAGAAFAQDGVVVLEAPGGNPALEGIARARFAPRATHTLLSTGTALDVLKLTIKALLARETRKDA